MVRAVDATAALEVEGVHAYVDINDVPGSNMVGLGPTRDDPLFADKEVCVCSILQENLDSIVDLTIQM